MRSLVAAALLLVSAIALAEEKASIAIALEPLGDRDQTVVARLTFRFANPRAITRAEVIEAWLGGDASARMVGCEDLVAALFTQKGEVARNFRFAVPRKGDRFVWNKAYMRNGKVERSEQWSVLPDQRNELVVERAFEEGDVEIDAWLVLDGDYDDPNRFIAHSTETFHVTRTNHVLPPEPVEVQVEPLPVELPPVQTTPVRIAEPQRNGELLNVSVDVLPPVKRVEFRIDDKKVLMRNAPPYIADLDLGSRTEAVVRAIGYDAAGRYVDADAFYIGQSDEQAAVKITRSNADGVEHFRLAIWNPQNVSLKSVTLYADDNKIGEWTAPPYTLSIPAADLAGVALIRAVVVDESGHEAIDQQPLH